MVSARLVTLLSVAGCCAASNATSTDGCQDFQDPNECINTGCLWLVIDGRCSLMDDPYAQANPSCCIGGEGSPCERRQFDDFKDGDCQLNLPSNGRVTEAPPIELSQRFAYLAGAAYCEQEQLQQWACGLPCNSAAGMIDVTTVAHYDFQAYIGFSQPENAVIVGFRGSMQDVINWAANLDAFKTYPFQDFPDAGVHRGFYNAWTVLRDGVISAVASLTSKHTVKKVYFTGHSLGGALAHHAAFDLSTNYDFVATVFTYGAPRTGDYKFAQLVLEKVTAVYRLTHRQDIVPHVPLQAMGFYHLSSEVFFPDEKGLNHRLCDGTGEDNTCSNNCGFLGCVSVSDHLTYLDFAMSGSCGKNLEGAAAVVV